MLTKITVAQLIAVAPVLAIVAAAIVALYQVHAKRQDEKLAAQLARLNRQLSELYGPLHAIFEAGERNWIQFVWAYSSDKEPIARRVFLPSSDHRFSPPGPAALTEYRRRMKHLFMPTNEAMEAAIAHNADLVIGKRMPHQFSDFLSHVAAAKLLVQRWQADEYWNGDWTQHEVEYGHPNDLKYLISASFEVLKEVQQKILTRKEKFVDEEQIEMQIDSRIKTLKAAWDSRIEGYVAHFSAVNRPE